MKILICFFVLVFSFSALAMTEVECTGRSQGTDIRLDIQGRYNQDYFKTALLWLKKDGASTTTRHQLNYRAPWGGLTRAEYSGSNLRVEIDIWPDSLPRWGRTYFANARINTLGSSSVTLNCRFPYITR